MDYNRHASQMIFEHFRCPSCGLIFISPIPNDLSKYYPESYHYVPESVDFLEAGFSHERYKIEIIQRYLRGGRLLEIGPSLGCFAYLAKKSGFEVETIEMDERCSRFLNEVAEIPTVNTDDICAALPALKPFDVIALWHVVEHLANPWEILDIISKSLNSGGILVLAAPNPDSFQFHLLGRYWPHLDAPRHLMLIPQQVIVKKMESLGMKVELITTNDEGGIGWNVFGWEYFFNNLSSNRMIVKVLRRFGRTVARLLSPIEKVEGRGSAYTVVFRKVV